VHKIQLRFLFIPLWVLERIDLVAILVLLCEVPSAKGDLPGDSAGIVHCND
jgi:hypothetical protein